MPFKFKLYHWLSWYYVAWLAFFLVLLIYIYNFSYDDSAGSIDLFGYSLIGLLLLAFAKPIISIKFYRHLKNRTHFTQQQLNIFVAATVLNILIIAFTAYMSLMQLVGVTEDADATNLSLFVSKFIFLFACVYMLCLDASLKSLIRTQHQQSINSIGDEASLL